MPHQAQELGLCDSLLTWLNTFSVIDPDVTRASELTDGLVITSVLCEVRLL